jgi:hypothetical protein
MAYPLAMPSSALALSARQFAPRRWLSPESSGSRDVRLSRRELPFSDEGSTQQPIGWLRLSLQRLGELANLELGWDDGTAQPIAPSVISAVQDFITSDLVSSIPTQPDIVPTLRGGLLIEWHTEAIDLIIEAAQAGNPTFYFLDNENGEEVEAPLGQRLDAISRAFTKLALPR